MKNNFLRFNFYVFDNFLKLLVDALSVVELYHSCCNNCQNLKCMKINRIKIALCFIASPKSSFEHELITMDALLLLTG